MKNLFLALFVLSISGDARADLDEMAAWVTPRRVQQTCDMLDNGGGYYGMQASTNCYTMSAVNKFEEAALRVCERMKDIRDLFECIVTIRDRSYSDAKIRECDRYLRADETNFCLRN